MTFFFFYKRSEYRLRWELIIIKRCECLLSFTDVFFSFIFKSSERLFDFITVISEISDFDFFVAFSNEKVYNKQDT